jgi:hypothetical protein
LTQLTKERIAVALGIVIITLSNIQGHFHPPFSIQWTPIFLVVIIAGINYPLYKSNFNLTVIYNYALLLFNDIFIRVYAGGTHDDEGRDWIALFFDGAFLLSTIAMIIYGIANAQKQETGSRSMIRKHNLIIIIISALVTLLIYRFFISGI